MIEEQLLISYLKEQKREYNKQVVILQKELTSSLMYNHKQEYIIKNLMYESMINMGFLVNLLLRGKHVCYALRIYYYLMRQRNSHMFYKIQHYKH